MKESTIGHFYNGTFHRIVASSKFMIHFTLVRSLFRRLDANFCASWYVKPSTLTTALKCSSIFPMRS